MVLKLLSDLKTYKPLFENDVKMYGTQAQDIIVRWQKKFENDVKMYGTQACPMLMTVSHTV